MKTIVITGARSGVGKTTLAKELQAVLPGSVFIKIGHHPPNPSNENLMYPQGTSFREIRRKHAGSRYLIIESNSILDELDPDCAIYLAADFPKPSAIAAGVKADIVSAQKINPGKIEQLSVRLDIDTRTMRRIAWLAGARPSPLSAIILAGGKSERMGEDKAFLKVNGVPLVERLGSLLRPSVDHLIISAGTECMRWNGMHAVADRYSGCGPLSGIHACLNASETEHNFIIACDIPLVNFAVMFKLLSFSEEYDIAAPSFTNGHTEPLFAFYRRQVFAAARRLLEKKEFSVRALFKECATHVQNFPDSAWYCNLNAPDDYRRFVSGHRSLSQEPCTVQAGVS